MSKLVALREALEAVDPGEGARADGWTSARRRTFLEGLAEGHTVEAACAHVGLSVASAYALKRRAGGEAFALGWRAATLLGRERLADRLTSRAIDGQIDTYTRADGEQVTRHRFDNRLGMSLLARLDRQAEGLAAQRSVEPVARPGRTPASPPPTPSADDPMVGALVVAADFPAFLDLVAADADAAAVRDFVEAGIALRYPQLPQLGAFGDAAGRPLFWWEGGGWRTALPPSFNYRGWQQGEPGDPDYGRGLTLDEQDIAEALYGVHED